MATITDSASNFIKAFQNFGVKRSSIEPVCTHEEEEEHEDDYASESEAAANNEASSSRGIHHDVIRAKFSENVAQADAMLCPYFEFMCKN